MLERINQYAAGIGERVQVIADQLNNQRMHEAHFNLMAGGQRFGLFQRPLDRIELGFDWVDSRAHRPLQASDMMTYVYLRRRWGRELMHPRAERELEKLRDIIAPTLKSDYIWTP